MGIKNLIRVIERFAPDAIRYKKIGDYKNKTLGVDANLMIYKMVYGIRKAGYDLKKGVHTTTHIHAIIQKIVGFKRYNIIPIFVFDGGFPQIKKKTLEQRKEFQIKMQLKYLKAVTQDEKKRYYFMKSGITEDEIDEVKTIIKIMGYQIIESTEEADAELAYMSKKGKIDGVITDDMDILVFGGRKLLKNFTVSDKKKIQEIDLYTLLKDMRITHKQLIDIGILLGCDYCPTVKGVGPIKSYQLVKEYGSLQKLVDNGIIRLNTDYKTAQNYFINPPVTKNLQKIKIDKKPKVDKKQLTKFLKGKGYQVLEINNILDKLMV